MIVQSDLNGRQYCNKNTWGMSGVLGGEYGEWIVKILCKRVKGFVSELKFGVKKAKSGLHFENRYVYVYVYVSAGKCHFDIANSYETVKIS